MATNGDLVDRDSTFNAMNPRPVIGSAESVSVQSRIWFDPGSRRA
jgi:hypothetical protein